MDSLKLKYLEKLIIDTQTKGIRLIFMISPNYKAKSSVEFDAAKEIIARYEVPFYDFYSDEEISFDKSFW